MDSKILERKRTYLLELGMTPIIKIYTLHRKKAFIIDANYGDEYEYAIYPSTKKAHVCHDLLNLYGTHWRYLVSNNDFLNPVKENEPKHKNPHSYYAFTQKYIDNLHSLFLINPEEPRTEGIYQNLKAQFEKHMKEYKEWKRRNKKRNI